MRRTTPAKGSGLPVARGKCCRSASALSHGRSIDIKDPKPSRRLPEDKIMLGGRKSPHGERRLWNCMADIIHRNHVGLTSHPQTSSVPAHFQCLVHGFPTSPTGPTKMEIVYFGSCDRYHTPSELHEMARETGPPSSLVSSQSRLPAALLGLYFLTSPRDLKSFAWSSKSSFHPPTSITIQPGDQPSEGYIPF
jgi:hypothetical protein